MTRLSSLQVSDPLVKTMLPSLGFFGATWADCLDLEVQTGVASVRVVASAASPTFLNIKGVLARRRKKVLSPSEFEIEISQSSDRPENELPPQGISSLVGIHTLKETNPWWQVSFAEPIDVDQLLIFNRSDKWGIRSRNLQVFVTYEDGHTETAYDSSSRSYLHEVLQTIERFGGANLANVELHSLAEAAKWRTDAAERVAYALRSGAPRPTKREWLFLSCLIPTEKKDPVLGGDLSGADWFLLAYGLCSQLARNSKSRSGVHSYAGVLDSRARLRRLEVEFPEAVRVLGIEPIHHVKHGLSPRGQLREQAPKLALLVERLRDVLDSHGHVPLLAYGSLLGAVRDGRLIDHDDDFDLFVALKADTFEDFLAAKSELYEVLLQAGWTVLPVKQFHNAHLKFGDSNLWLDLFAVWIDDDKAWTHMEKMNWRSMPSVWFLSGPEVTVDGITVNMPRESEPFLLERYGDKWGVPDKFDDWRWPLTS